MKMQKQEHIRHYQDACHIGCKKKDCPDAGHCWCECKECKHKK